MVLVDAPLFGVPWTHLRPPLKSFFVGSVSPKQNPELFLKAVHELFSFYRTLAMDLVLKNAQGQVPPLVVNMHGWIKGIGLEILFNMLKTIRPNYIVQLHGESDEPVSFELLFEQMKKENEDIELPSVHNLVAQVSIAPRYILCF
jgi:polynucleotide 5'-kinase involved in rRNA processing